MYIFSLEWLNIKIEMVKNCNVYVCIAHFVLMDTAAEGLV